MSRGIPRTLRKLSDGLYPNNTVILSPCHVIWWIMRAEQDFLPSLADLFLHRAELCRSQRMLSPASDVSNQAEKWLQPSVRLSSQSFGRFFLHYPWKQHLCFLPVPHCLSTHNQPDDDSSVSSTSRLNVLVCSWSSTWRRESCFHNVLTAFTAFNTDD